MKNKLIVIGIVVSVYMVFVIQALMVGTSTKVEAHAGYWLGYENIKWILIGGCFIFSIHIITVIRAAVQKKIEWHWAIPFLLMPYMIGVTIQGLLF